jgi:carbon monoxide dehydrogenase subunit G
VELTHTFTVPASLEDTWAAFQDIESVAGCFPGATVTEVSGDDFKGSCKVKLGPIALVYSGSGTFQEKDESAHRFVVVAKGKDKRGNGTAGATVTATMTGAGGDSTDVHVLTDLAITGKPAQFGRGVIQDVSDKLLQQFVTCLQSRVGATEQGGDGTGSTDATDSAGGADTADGVATAPALTQFEPSEAGSSETAGSGAEVSAGGVVGARKAPATTYSGASAGGAPATTPGPSPSPDDNALDLGATLLPVLAKAYWRPLTGGAVVLLVVYLLRRRRR